MIKYKLQSLTYFSDMTTVLATLTPECRDDECVKHALAVRSALALSSYHRFFKLYKKAPKMSGYLMDWFADKVRLLALKAIVKAYVTLVLTLSFHLCLNSTNITSSNYIQ